MQHPAHPFDLAVVVATDHRLLQTLLGRIERYEGRRQILFDQVIRHLSTHASAVEHVIGPALVEIGDTRSAQENVAAMRPVKQALAELDRHDAGTDEAELAMRVVLEAVRAQQAVVAVDQVPRLRAELGDDRMVELGREFLDHARRAPTRPHPQMPSAGVVSAPAALVDKVRDRMSGRDLEHTTDASGLLDPQAQLLVDELAALGARPPHLLDPAAARRQPTFAAAVDAYLRREGRHTGPEEVALVQERTVPGPGPGDELPVRVYQPATADPAAAGGTLPMLVYVHGGGWVLGSIDAADAACRSMANRTGAVVLSVGYRLAPEHPFPAAFEDVTAAVVWARHHAGELGGDPVRVALAGEGAGATMTLATALDMVDAGEWRPSALVLVSPFASTHDEWASFGEAADAAPWSSATVLWALGHLVRSADDLADPRLDVLSCPSERLAGLPPVVLVTAGRDPLRDQGEALATRLHDAGVHVEAVRYPGVPHGFFGAAAVLDAAIDAQRRAARALRATFGAALATDDGRR